MPNVNPEILIWARETAGLTSEAAAGKLGFQDSRKWTAVERLRAYESGQSPPSPSVLNRMAEKYRRPILIFYLPKPPLKGNTGADFRTMSAASLPEDEATLDALLRDVRVRQSILRAALEDEDEAEPLPFINSMGISDGKAAVLAYMNALLNVDARDYRTRRDDNDAFNLLRTAVERVGVFVILRGNLGSYHTDIFPETFRGFALSDEVAPFIVINPNDARPAWSFTLLHELAHLLLGQTGVGNLSFDNGAERFCDDVAGDFLLPDDELLTLAIDAKSDTPNIGDVSDRISQFANEHNLSRRMIAYKAYRNGALDRNIYDRLASDFRGQWFASRKRRQGQGGGPDFYILHKHRIGAPLISLTNRMMSAGALSTTKAAKVLGVKPQRVQTLFDSVSPGRM